MGSSSKSRTTWAKLNREAKLRDKRAAKQARKAARMDSEPLDAAEVAAQSDELGSGLGGGDEPESAAATSDAPGEGQ